MIHGNIPSYLYVAPENVFSKPNDKIPNDCYCELASIHEEHVNGVLEVSDCIDGSPPVLASHPHFMEGDEKLIEHFEGIAPNRSLHDSFVYLHSRFSVPVFGTSRMQLNLKLSHHKNYYKHFPNGLILPLGWVETTTDVIPDEFKFKLYLSTVVVDFTEAVIKYGSVFTFIVSLTYILFTLMRCHIHANHEILRQTAWLWPLLSFFCFAWSLADCFMYFPAIRLNYFWYFSVYIFILAKGTRNIK